MKDTALMLVLITGNIYSRYVGRRMTHQFASTFPMTTHWVERLRTNPEEFEEPLPEPGAA